MNELVHMVFLMFTKSHIRWLLYILVFEYLVAVSLSPTILSDYFLASYFVEKMSFISAVHALDNLAVYPEVTCFFIALSFFLLIPKTVCIYLFFHKNPYSERSQYVITPYTKFKPSRTLNVGEELTEEEGKELLTVERSMFSRIMWSLSSLGLAFTIIISNLNIGGDVLNPREFVYQSLIQGGAEMWLSFSVYSLCAAAAFTAVSIFIIKDYFRLFIEIVRRVVTFIF